MSEGNQKQLHSEDFLKPAVTTALYYGFMPLHRVTSEAQKANSLAKTKRKLYTTRSAFNKNGGELFDALEVYVNNKFDKLKNPIFFYHSSAESTRKNTKKENAHMLTLQSIGSPKSIGEALIIKTALKILEEMNINDTCVHINTTGDRDSTLRYNKALQTHFRKHLSTMPPAAQSALKKSSFNCLSYLHKKDHELYHSAPQSMEFLSEKSRKHLRELLEYFESADIPYIIDKSLVDHDTYYPKLMFEIRTMCDDDYEQTKCSDANVYARGYRYDDLAKKIFKSEIPATCITFEYQKDSKGHAEALNPKSIKRPKVHFIQFGFDAKLKSLGVIEQLRQAHIPIHQSLGNDRLSSQLEIAENMKIPYTIIMGQKEVLDETVIIRDMKTRAQEIVPIDKLPQYIKEIKF